jgi:hypothetical protein
MTHSMALADSKASLQSDALELYLQQIEFVFRDSLVAF